MKTWNLPIIVCSLFLVNMSYAQINSTNQPRVTRDCLIESIDSVSFTPCNPNTNSFDARIRVRYNRFRPSEGSLVINGEPYAFDPSSNFLEIDLKDLPARGGILRVNAFFENDPACKFEEDFVNIASFCGCCRIREVALGRKSCDEDSNTYFQELEICYRFAPNRGKLVVRIPGLPDQKFSYNSNAPCQTVILSGLPLDNEREDLEIFFENSRFCSMKVRPFFQKPEDCEEEAEVLITSFTLIDVTTGEPISGYDPIPDGADIDISKLPSDSITIKANTFPESLGSVRLRLTDEDREQRLINRLENFPPYALFANRDSLFNSWNPTPPPLGVNFKVEAIPFTKPFGRGEQGIPLTLSLKFINNAPPPVDIIEETQSEVSFVVYPNPSEGTIVIEAIKDIQPANLLIYDQKGDLIYQKNVSGDFTEQINVNRLPKGEYYAKIVNSKGTKIKRFVLR